MPSVGRKFLLAGRGGLNLTHSEPMTEFWRATATRSLSSRRSSTLSAGRARRLGGGAGPTDLCRLVSGRVFPEDPEGLAAAPAHGCGGWIQSAWTPRSAALNGTHDGRFLSFVTSDGPLQLMPIRLCWRWAAGPVGRARVGRRMGENPCRQGRGDIAARRANCGSTIAWSDIFCDRFEGEPLKGAAFSFGCGGYMLRGESCYHSHRHRGRRYLCTVGRFARGHYRFGPGNTAHRRGLISRRG